MEQIHLRISTETKRHLDQIAKENNESVNGISKLALDDYVKRYYANTVADKSIPQIDNVLRSHLNEFSSHLRSLIARGVLDNAVSMLGIIDLVAQETGKGQKELYDMYRELAYVRVKDREELFKDLDILEKYRDEMNHE
ncbi:hypothetical protein [Mammaliicoccus sp. D-M17]|uniref:hypothetical protein n=1 Tax=Mammaliicoccus sp. D-M17 TaxID=2898677 RepID=UPI001EFB0176|nr:hypothetical protein [Mammaliicoccus sp. D-M17]